MHFIDLQHSNCLNASSRNIKSKENVRTLKHIISKIVLLKRMLKRYAVCHMFVERKVESQSFEYTLWLHQQQRLFDQMIFN